MKNYNYIHVMEIENLSMLTTGRIILPLVDMEDILLEIRDYFTLISYEVTGTDNNFVECLGHADFTNEGALHEVIEVFDVDNEDEDRYTFLEVKDFNHSYDEKYESINVDKIITGKALI